MSDQYAIVPYEAQASQLREKTAFEARDLSKHLGTRLVRFLEPVLRHLHAKIDLRPVRTLVQTVEAILAFRDRCNGLLLSELGAYLDGLGPGGGTKRLGTLVRHLNWQAELIEEFLLVRADQAKKPWEEQGEDGLVIWDGTVLEKPESLKPEGLCAVRSSKAGRLTHIKKGYYHPPSAPIFVPGVHGIGVLLASRAVRGGVAQLAVLRWWTSRGVQASWERDENCKLLRQLQQRWGHSVVHVFDRGYASSLWVGAQRSLQTRFILRWKGEYHLLDESLEKKAAWKIARGKRGLAARTVYDAVHRCNVEGSVLFFPVTHPHHLGWRLFLVIGRRKGGKPWYLLTNEEVKTAEDAWKIVMAYARRWQVEMSFRNLKSELAIQSLRVYAWETRLKLLALVTLAYAFLMDLMGEQDRAARDWLIDYACHRTGRHLQEVELPFSRLRIALSKLWLTSPCSFVRRAALLL